MLDFNPIQFFTEIIINNNNDDDDVKICKNEKPYLQ